MDSHTDSLRIFLSAPEAKAIVEKADTAEAKYIILQNDHLHFDNRSLRLELQKTENKLEALEDDMDKQEKSSTYMKGLLKNFIELDDMRAKVTEAESQIAKKTQKHLSDFHSIATKDFRCVSAFMMLYVAITFLLMSAVDAIAILFIVGGTVYVQETVMARLPSSQYTEERKAIKDMLAKIKEVTDSQSFLHDHIDSL